jgi:hypothetical protein
MLNIKIDFNNCYEIEAISTDLTISKFNTVLKDRRCVAMGILISNQEHNLLPDVYNLSFGPIHHDNTIDDMARVTHADLSRFFSTVIFTALAFLTNNKQKYLGIDGANNARAYLYYRLIQNNYDTLTQYFDIYGVNYYVRILRKTKDSDDCYPFDPDDIEVIPMIIKKGKNIPPEKLFNYFIFRFKR